MTAPASFLWRLIAVTLTSLLLVAHPAAAQERKPFDHSALAQRVLTQHIRPGYARLAAAAGEFANVVAVRCASADSSDRSAVTAAFKALVEVWGRIEHINFGPIEKSNRRERILFWPDRKQIGQRQIEKALRARDADVLDAVALADRSVALQGIGAAELVLFAPASRPGEDAETRAHRCGFGKAIATTIKANADAISAEWMAADGFAKDWLAPGAAGSPFLKPSETTLAIAKAFDQGLERVRDQRIAGPLGLNKQRIRHPSALGRSSLAVVLVRANIEGLEDLLLNGGLASAITETKVVEAGSTLEIYTRIVARELETARNLATGLAGRPDPFTDPASTQSLIAMGFPLKNARDQTAALLTLSANLTLGLNATDGD